MLDLCFNSQEAEENHLFGASLGYSETQQKERGKRETEREKEKR